MGQMRGGEAKAMEAVAALENKRMRDSWSRGVRKDADIVLGKNDNRILTEVVKEASLLAGVLTSELYGKSQRANIARARQFAFYQCEKLGMKHKAIARAFDRDVTTIAHGIKKVKEELGK